MASVNLLRKRFQKLVFSDNSFALLLKNSGYLVTSNVGAGLLNLVYGVLVARALGAEQYGKLVVVMAVVSTINALTSFRLGEFVVKYLTEALEDGNVSQGAAIVKFSYIIEMVSSSFAFLLIFIFASRLSGWFLNSSEDSLIIVIYAFSLLANLLLETSGGVLQSFKKFQLLAKLAFLQSVFVFFFVLIVYVTNAGMWGMLYAYVFGAAVQTIFFQRVAFKLLTERLGENWGSNSLYVLNGRWKIIGKFLFNTNIGMTLSLVTKTSDPLWLGYFRGPIEAGYYKLALSLANLLVMPISTLSQVFFPDVTAIVKQNRFRQLKTFLFSGTVMALTWLLPASILCYVLSKQFIPIIYGNEFLPSIPALGLILVGLGIANCLFWTRSVLIAFGSVNFITYVNLGVACLKILLTLLLVPHYGYLANAGILSLLYIVGFSLMLIYIRIQINQKLENNLSY